MGPSLIVNIVLLILSRSQRKELTESENNLDNEKRKNNQLRPSTQSSYNGNEEKLKSKITNLESEISKKDSTINSLSVELDSFKKKSTELISASKTHVLYFDGFNRANELKVNEGKNSFTEGDSIYKIENVNGKYTYSVCEQNNTFKNVKDTISGSIESFCTNENSFSSNNHTKIRTITPGTLSESNGILTISTKAKIRYE